MESRLLNFLKSYPYSVGNLYRDLAKGSPFRKEARELSARNASFGEVTEFQWDLVHATSWGAYGFYGFNDKLRLLDILEKRLNFYYQ
jgi:hypothetical protein